jgi:type I restriction-modification system DNA methylase subunit
MHKIVAERYRTDRTENPAAGLGALFQGEQSKSERLWQALKGGSKNPDSKEGQGIPEAAIFRDIEHSDPIALIECKKHMNIGKAQKEAQGYVKHVSSRGIHVPLAIGFDGHDLSVDFYNSATGEFVECRMENGKLFRENYRENLIWPSENELLELAKSKDGLIKAAPAPLGEHIQGDFFRRINEVMRLESVETQDRITVFTAFLIACREEGFLKQIISPPKKLDANKLGRDIHSSIAAMMESSDDEGIGQDLKGFLKYVEPKLVEASAKEKSTNGANALQRIIREDIPVICSKHHISVQNFMDSLNESLFKIVDVYDVFQTYAASNDLGQYFTPRQTVRSMVRIVEQLRGRRIDSDDIVYDPACGVGGFLVAALERVSEGFCGADKVVAKKTFGRRLLGCETTTSVAHIARINLWMHGDGTSGIASSSSLERDYLANRGGIGDHIITQPTPANHPVRANISTLAKKLSIADASPTIVLMNPPFPHDKKDFQSFEFVEHALSVLRDEGILCALLPVTTIMSDDKLHSCDMKGSVKNADGFRSRILNHAQLLAIISLPMDLFQPGAAVATYVAVFRKCKGGHKLNQKILFARCPTDGYLMSKSLKKRMGPKSNTEKSTLGWDEELKIGGSWADLLVDRDFQPDGTIGRPSWIRQHCETGLVDIYRQAVSKCLTKQEKDSGQDWAPERFINDVVPVGDLVKMTHKITAERLAFEVMSSYATQKSIPILQNVVVSLPLVQSVLQKLNNLYGNSPVIDDVFIIEQGDKTSVSKLSQFGVVPVVSASTSDLNMVTGYMSGSVSKQRKAWSLVVSKDGSYAGTARVMPVPHRVTEHSMSLTPRAVWSNDELSVLAALIERHQWRFGFGRAATRGRIEKLPMC